MRTTSLAAIAAAFVCLASAAVPAQSQDYPAKEIHTIVPFGPGTGADIFVRFFANKLSEVASKPVIVENKPGAQGNIASEIVARAKPDGYTIYITPASSTLAGAVHLFKKLPFDPVKDFEPVVTLASLSFVAAVSSHQPVQSMAELTQYLKKKPKGASFYSTGANTGIVSAELYARAIGVELQRVAFRTPSEMMNELISGSIDFTFTDATWVAGQAMDGRLRPLAIAAPRRSGSLPTVPTLAEAGYPGIEVVAWWAVAAPARTPQPILDRLAVYFEQIMAMPDTKQFLGKAALDPMPGNAEFMRKLLLRDIDKWAEWVKIAKIDPQ